MNFYNIEIDHNNLSAKAFFEGMLWAAFGGVQYTSDSVYEWLIDAVKECAFKLKESEIEHISLPTSENHELKCK